MRYERNPSGGYTSRLLRLQTASTSSPRIQTAHQAR